MHSSSSQAIPLYGFDRWSKLAKDYPITCNILKQVKGLKTAIFSKLKPHTTLIPHYGWAKLANNVLRAHIGITVPANCGLWVEGETRIQYNNQWLLFDDSKLHTAFNNSDSDRIVLLLDLERPYYIPKGQSDIEDSTELKDLLNYL